MIGTKFGLRVAESFSLCWRGKNPIKYMYFYRLLDVLAGRKDSRGLSGDVLINGELPPADFKCNSGYVVQVSIHGSLCFYMSQCLELRISVLPVNYMMCL